MTNVLPSDDFRRLTSESFNFHWALIDLERDLAHSAAFIPASAVGVRMLTINGSALP